MLGLIIGAVLVNVLRRRASMSPLKGRTVGVLAAHVGEPQILARDVASASHLARRFHADVGFGYQTLTMPLVTYCAVKGCAVGMTIRDVIRNFYTLPFRRVHPLPGLPASTPSP